MRTLCALLLGILCACTTAQALSAPLAGELASLAEQLRSQTGITARAEVGDISAMQAHIASWQNYAVLAIDPAKKEIAVLSDLGMDFAPITHMYYLKFGFLPTKGAVLPLLTDAKGGLEPALLNGFIAMCELIAHARGAKLDGVGEFNDNFIAVLRLIFYISIVVIIILIIRKKRLARK